MMIFEKPDGNYMDKLEQDLKEILAEKPASEVPSPFRSSRGVQVVMMVRETKDPTPMSYIHRSQATNALTAVNEAVEAVKTKGWKVLSIVDTIQLE